MAVTPEEQKNARRKAMLLLEHMDRTEKGLSDRLRQAGFSAEATEDSVRKLDVLQELIEDETVTEIMVNGPDSIFVERKGKLTRWPKSFTDQEKLEDCPCSLGRGSRD